MEVMFLLIGLLMVAAIVYAVVRILKYTVNNLRKHLPSTAAYFLVRVALALAGVAAGVLCVFFRYNMSETLYGVGLPIPWAWFEYRNGAWSDFFSPLSPLAFVVNFIAGFGAA